MMVIDASAAMSAVREGENSSVVSFLKGEGEEVIAPSFFGVETAEVAWKYAHVGMTDTKGATKMLRGAVGLVDAFVPDPELAQEALVAAVRLDHSFYDMLYFVLAERTSSALLTCDKRLAKLCEENNVDCITVSEI